MKINDLNIGDRVQVTDGTQRPPAHHKRKLATWMSRNYTGTVADIEQPGEMHAEGAANIGQDRFALPSGGYMMVEVVPARRILFIVPSEETA